MRSWSPAQIGAGPAAELGTDDAAGDQEQREDDVDGMRVEGMEEAGQAGDEGELKERGADDDAGRHADQIDHRRDEDEAAADAQAGGEQPDEHARHERHERRDVEPRLGEAHLERQPVQPIMLVQPPAQIGQASPPEDGTDALDEHQETDHAQQQHVGERDERVDLAGGPYQPEDKDADGGADEAAHGQDDADAQVHGAAAELGQHAGDGGGHDLDGARADGHGGRDADEDEQRGHQEPAAHAERPGEEADCRAEPENEEKVH